MRKPTLTGRDRKKEIKVRRWGLGCNEHLPSLGGRRRFETSNSLKKRNRPGEGLSVVEKKNVGKTQAFPSTISLSQEEDIFWQRASIRGAVQKSKERKHDALTKKKKIGELVYGKKFITGPKKKGRYINRPPRNLGGAFGPSTRKKSVDTPI